MDSEKAKIIRLHGEAIDALVPLDLENIDFTTSLQLRRDGGCNMFIMVMGRRHRNHTFYFYGDRQEDRLIKSLAAAIEAIKTDNFEISSEVCNATPI